MVGIAVDGTTGYGRGVMRGVMRYANLQRRWLIHEQMRSDSKKPWPQCDGVIIAGLSRDAYHRLAAQAQFVVHCSGTVHDPRTPAFCLDDMLAGETAANHLLDCHLEHFGFFGRSWSPISVNRAMGFQSAIGKRGYSCSMCPADWPEPDQVENPHWPQLIEWIREQPKPLGVMAVDDSAAHDLAAACLHYDIPVPEQVAIIGVNNDDLLCESAWPPISSVEGDFSRMGYAAAAMMERMLEGYKPGASEMMNRFPPLGVVRRMSTDVLAIDDPNVAAALQYIRLHACDPCSVPDVLREVPVNRRWLERQFVEKLGRTPHEEITRVRMQTAERLLLRADLTLPMVSHRCGFSAVSNFAQTFRKATKTTPGQYRKSALPRT
jgi:LacI family transcriptional regulator